MNHVKIEKEELSSFKSLCQIKSIQEDGVLTPLMVAPDMTIISGHQRYKACKELGIETIPCKITHYKDYDEELHRTKEDMILEDLISTNIFQRGIGNVTRTMFDNCKCSLVGRLTGEEFRGLLDATKEELESDEEYIFITKVDNGYFIRQEVYDSFEDEYICNEWIVICSYFYK